MSDDTPYTKAVSAALAEKPKRKAAEPVGPVDFISREPEAQIFEIMGLRPARREDQRLVWNVPADLADRFARHHHVVTGRVVPSDAKL